MTVPCCPDAFQMLDGSDGFVGQNRRPWHIRTTTDQTLRPRKPDVDSAIHYSVATICDAVLYRVGVVPRDETLLTHQLVASPSIQIGGERVNIERCASRLSIERGQAMPFSTRYAGCVGFRRDGFPVLAAPTVVVRSHCFTCQRLRRICPAGSSLSCLVA